MKKAGEEWAKMTEKDKKPYEKIHEADQKRYQKELAQLIKEGYFVNSDGVKSSDIEKKLKKEKKKENADPEEKVEKIKRKKD